jgi:predicted amidohydrolase
VPDRIRVACVQLSSGSDTAANLERAEALVAAVAEETPANRRLDVSRWSTTRS